MERMSKIKIGILISCGSVGLFGWVRLFIDSIEFIATFYPTSCVGMLGWPAIKTSYISSSGRRPSLWTCLLVVVTVIVWPPKIISIILIRIPIAIVP